MATFVSPGQLCGEESAGATAGAGTYALSGRVFASRSGTLRIEETAPSTKRYTVISPPRRTRGGSSSNAVPAVGDVVIGRIERVNPRFAKLAIVCIGNVVLANQFMGTIQVLDIRAFEKDKVDVYGSFRPNDIVRAEVISLGDSRSYFLTTAKDTLGVIYARSLAGAAMVPLSWEEMVCPVTKTREARKIARVAPEADGGEGGEGEAAAEGAMET